MTEYLLRRLPSAAPVSPWLWWTGLFLLLALGPTSVVLSQERANPGQYFSTLGDTLADADEAQAGPVYSDRFTGRSGQAYGALVRGGYLTGPGVGREKGLAPIEFMPYLFLDQGLIFGNLRGFRSDGGRYGANSGLGYRQYVEPWDRIFGVNFFHDYDNTSGQLFRQMGFGVETYGQFFDIRANAYFPYGTQMKLLDRALVDGSQKFSGHELLYDIMNTFGSSLKGMDAEIGVPIPSPVARRHDLRVFAGGYHYESNATGAFNGWSGRLQGNLIPSLQVQLQVTNDPVFDTNVVFSAQWSFGGFRQPDDEPKNQFDRMTTPIRRQYNIAIARTNTFDRDNVAINPVNGLPYFFDHVASYAPAGGDGTVEHPFQTIDQTNPNFAQDIVFVHANSVFNGDIDGNGVPDNVVTLQENVRFLGEGNGVVHTVNVEGIGLVTLPRATAFPNRPLFTNGIGDGVTLVSNSEFSGFVMGDPTTPGSGPTGNGVFGNGGVHNVRLSQDDFNYAGQEGMRFENAGGNISIPKTRIFNPTGIALHVLDGTPGIVFSGDSIPSNGDITNTGAPALVVENTLAGSTVNLTGSDIINTGSATHGIFIDNVAGNVTVDQATINNAGTFGIQILDSSGDFSFRGDILVGNPADDAINITNLLAGGTSSFTGNVAINNRNAAGVNLVNISGVAQFLADVNMGLGFAGAAPGINWQDSAGTVVFNNIAINGSGGDGIDLGVNGFNTGIFRVNGSPVINGLISDVALNIQNNTITSQVVFNAGIDIASRGIVPPVGVLPPIGTGVLVVNNNGQVQFGGLTNIANPLNGRNPAVDIRNNLGNVRFTDLTITAATSGGDDGYGAGMNVQDNLGQVSVQGDLDITTANGIALFVLNAGDTTIPAGGISVNNGALIATGLPAVDIENSVYFVRLTSVRDTGSVRQGIRLENNVGTGGLFDFSVTGVTNQAGTGGTISGATFAGVRVNNTNLTTLADTTNNIPLTYVGNVSLANMILSGNLFGVHSIQSNEIQMIGDQVINNRQEGLLAVDTKIVDVENSLFTGNGGANPFNEIHIAVTIPDNPNFTGVNTDDYQFSILNNQITDRGADAILVENNITAISGSGAHASLLEELNTISLTLQGIAGTTVSWDGTIDAQFDRNIFNLLAGAQFGINFITTSPLATDSSNLRILTNDFEGAVGGNEAIRIDAAANATVNIGTFAGQPTGNIINFAGTPLVDANGFIFLDTGVEFVNLGQNSRVNIDDIQGTIDSDGATAILFTSVQSPGSIEIGNNNFQITGLNGFFRERGVIFTSVIGGQMNVSSNVNNVINFIGTNFFTTFAAPNNSLNGSITINGTQFP